jgi:ABC-type multidrug transport system fused ATPase/permease subunit
MNFSRLIRFVTPHRHLLALVVVLLGISSLLSLLQPWLAGQLTGVLLGTGDTRWELQHILLFWLALIVLRSALGFACQYAIGSTGELMTAHLRTALYQHMQSLPLGYFHQRRSGDMLAMLSHDADIISGFVTTTLVQLLPLAVTFGGAFLIMAWIDPLIAGVTVALLPAYYLVMKLVGRRIRPVSRAWIDAYSDLVTLLGETLDMIPAIKAFTREKQELERFDEVNRSLLSLSRRQLFIQALLAPAVGLTAGLGLLLLLWLGSMRIASGTLTPAELVSLLLYAMMMNAPLKSLADVYGRIQVSRGAAERLVDFLGQQPEPVDEGLPDLGEVAGDIRFDAVDFHYPGGPPVLRALDLRIGAGETVAITGPNGVGKSTLAHLLLRFADPDGGRIYIDNIDIAKVSLASLRARVGMVSQHTLLVNGSIAENILYGCPSGSAATMQRAAALARADEFIEALPAGYDTIVGEQGIRLSGGQRQRLSLARTLLTDPPILVLDEATAMFDPPAEAEFLEQCRALLGEKTVILITHRPASLALADRQIHFRGTDETNSAAQVPEA